MKSCHLCERILKGGQILECFSCSKVICHPCIYKYFNQRKDILQTIQLKEPFHRKINRCLICTKECPCMKCKTVESVIYTNPKANKAQVINKINNFSLVSSDEPIPESGLFKGKKINEMPLFMQRIYLKKKALYTNHQLSKNNSTFLLQPQHEQPDEKDRREEKRQIVDESVMRNIEEQEQENIAIIDEQNLEEEQREKLLDDEDQDQDYESEFSSRRAKHVHKHDQHLENQQGAQSQLLVQAEHNQLKSNQLQSIKPQALKSKDKDGEIRRKMIRQRLQIMKDESSPAEVMSE